MMCRMTQDWARLGARLRAAREDELHLTQEELGARIGVGRNAIRLIESGQAKRLTATIRAYVRQAGWTDDSAEAVLAGGEPALRTEGEGVETGPPAAADAAVMRRIAEALVERLPERVLQELTDGRVVDTDIMDLSKDGSSAIMTLVVERDASPAPDKVQSDLREWGQVQREMRRILMDRHQ